MISFKKGLKNVNITPEEGDEKREKRWRRHDNVISAADAFFIHERDVVA